MNKHKPWFKKISTLVSLGIFLAVAGFAVATSIGHSSAEQELEALTQQCRTEDERRKQLRETLYALPKSLSFLKREVSWQEEQAANNEKQLENYRNSIEELRQDSKVQEYLKREQELADSRKEEEQLKEQLRGIEKEYNELRRNAN